MKSSYMTIIIKQGKEIPGPSNYSPNINRIKPKIPSALCRTGEQRMSFQKAATVTPSPADYHSEDSNSRMSFRSSLLRQGEDFF